MDNKVAVAYIQRRGGTKSSTLMKEVRPILDWVQIHLADLKAIYIPASAEEAVVHNHSTAEY